MASDNPKNIRCDRCAGPLSNEIETSKWTINPITRDFYIAAGYSVAVGKSTLYGFERAIPVLQRRIKGPRWLHYLIAAPPVFIFAAGCSGLGGGAAPALAQLASSSYHAALSSPPSKDEKIQKPRTSSTL